MKRSIFFSGLVLLGMSACDNQPKFTIEGTITGAADKMLYLETADLGEMEILDSTKLSANGDFRFKEKGVNAPEFYRLRLENQFINLSIDSTEVVTVKADAKKMAENYQVSGSENCSHIKELTTKLANLQTQISQIAQSKSLAPGEIQDSISRAIESHKNIVKRQYIFKDPTSASSYFALFQRINNYLLFDPLNSHEDIKCFAAVATSWDLKYPHAERAMNLHNIAIKGMKNTRKPITKTVELKEDQIKETGIIDIALKDLNGTVRKVSDLKGKTVLIDFTVYENAASPTRNIALNELYQKYKAQGFEIYQIALDADEHYWKTTADNLPWVCVRDENGIYSSYVSIYNVQHLPTFFLVNKNSELKMRSESIKNLDSEIQKLL